MTNKTVTLSRELLSKLVEPGCEGSVTGDEWAWLRAACADPVPPAGGEPETIAYTTNGRTRVVLADQKAEAVWNAGRPLIYLEDHRAHVTRLQAEVERLNAAAPAEGLRSALAESIKQRDALQAELTKARECLKDIRQSCELSKLRDAQIDEILANQSAPAAKDGE
jgi:hypothetical protein